MSITRPIRDRIKALKQEYDRLRPGKDSLLKMIDETEIPESVYNSNAIENSTLSLKETEKILLEMTLSREVSLREVFEAKNLARITNYIRTKAKETELSRDLILLLHEMLISNIDDRIAGRFRQKNEYVRVGLHIAPAPEHVERMMEELLAGYGSDMEKYFSDKIAKFHLDFETIHPFIDGNGRMGRMIINYQLSRLGYPWIIIRDKEKKIYYQAFNEHHQGVTKTMDKVIALALIESLHKRITYLKGEKIVTLAEFAKTHTKKMPALLNAARRQNIPAFRERGVWKIGQQ